MEPSGNSVWSVASPILDLRAERDVLGVSADGKVVEFGDYKLSSRFRFDTHSLKLSTPPRDEKVTLLPRREGLTVEDWIDRLDWR
jgi:hypothetical protein